MRVVVIGGGTGAPKSIRAALSLGWETTAVVAMADDGGSTGILRRAAGATPPGDIRKCLAAMAADPDAPLTKAFQRRFDFADDHALGNLVLYAFEQETGNFPRAIALCEELLGARGRVCPSTLSPVSLFAELADGSSVAGQARASHAPCALRRVWLDSPQPIEAYGPAIDALQQADAILLGPGSLFTSIVANLLVPGIAQAVRDSAAKVVFVCPVADTQGETQGMSALDCYRALCSYGLEGCVDEMIVHWPSGHGLEDEPAQVPLCPEALSVAFGRRDLDSVTVCGTHVTCADLTRSDMPTWHDEAKLACVFGEVL